MFLIRSEQAEIASERCRGRVVRLKRIDAIDERRNRDRVAARQAFARFGDPFRHRMFAGGVHLGQQGERLGMRSVELQRQFTLCPRRLQIAGVEALSRVEQMLPQLRNPFSGLVIAIGPPRVRSRGQDGQGCSIVSATIGTGAAG